MNGVSRLWDYAVLQLDRKAIDRVDPQRVRWIGPIGMCREFRMAAREQVKPVRKEH